MTHRDLLGARASEKIPDSQCQLSVNSVNSESVSTSLSFKLTATIMMKCPKVSSDTPGFKKLENGFLAVTGGSQASGSRIRAHSKLSARLPVSIHLALCPLSVLKL